MLKLPETYLQKAESFEKTAERLKERTDPIGRKLFASAERSARRFRGLAEMPESIEDRRPPA